METITIKVPKGKKAEWVNGVLTLIDEREITDRVKSYSDACEVLGIKERCFDGMEKDEIAYLKLKTITKALNEDDEFPKFIKKEKRWYPWYYLYTQSEIDKMNDKDKSRLCLWGGTADYGSLCGLSAAYASYVFSDSYASFGARLAFKTESLAKYSGTQFVEIWKDFLICK